MAIWKMARDQHIFYRTRRSPKGPVQGMSSSEIVRILNRLHHANLSPSSSQSSLSIESAKSNQTQASAEAVAAAKAAQNEMYSALTTKRTALQLSFQEKLLRYKEILIKEMQITGIPPEGLTAEEIERMRKKFGVSFKFSKFVLDNSATDGGGLEEDLQRQLEIQMSIIEASRNLLSQSNSRRMKKERKKEIKAAEDKMARLEVKLQEMRKARQGGGPSSAKFNVDTPSSAYSSVHIPSSAPTSRRTSAVRSSGGSVDDSYLATIIFDSPNKPNSSSSSGLAKSPHHKSTSALNDLQQQQSMGQAGPHLLPSSASKHTPISVTQSFALPLRHKQSVSSVHSDKSFTLDPNHSASYLSSMGFADDYDTSPPLSVVSANVSTVSHGTRRDDNSLRDFDLTEDILQHFSKEGTGMQTSSPIKPTSQHLSPRKPNMDPGYHFNLSPSSSPIPRPKRSSSPSVFPPYTQPPGVPMGHTRSSSPDVYPGSHQAQANLSRNATFSGANIQVPSRPYPSHSSPQPMRKAGPRLQAGPPNPHWYDSEQDHSGYVNHDTSAGASRPGPRTSGAGVRSGDEVHLEDMLKTWQESSTNPFGEGTLV